MRDFISPSAEYSYCARQIAEQLIDDGYFHVDVDELKKVVPSRELLRLVGLQIEMATNIQKVDYLSEGEDSALVAAMLASYLKNLGRWNEKSISLSLLEAMSNNAAEFSLPIIVEDVNQRLYHLAHNYSHAGDAA